MPSVAGTYSAAEIAAEAGFGEDQVLWLAGAGLLTPDEHGRLARKAPRPVLIVR